MLAACAGVALEAVAKPPGEPPEAVIQWSMAERTTAVENLEFKPELFNGERHWMIQGPGGEPGLYGGVSSVPLDQINPPDGYRITLDGCSSTGSIKQYQWRINGKRVPNKATDCVATTYLHEGTYEVELEVKFKGHKDTVTEEIQVKDLLLVFLGDSYSSGEGNPRRYDPEAEDSTFEETLANDGKGFSEGGLWDHANCHRSTRSGQANAAIDLEQADPHTSVTTIYLACSGAQMDSGINGAKNGYLGEPDLPQTYQAYELVLANGRDIDALIMGIAGNDIGFVPIVGEGAVKPDVFLSDSLVPDVGTPRLPLVGSFVQEASLGDLLLEPDPDYADPEPLVPPGPPNRDLEIAALHACDSQYQKAAIIGGLGPEEACRTSIGTTEFGLDQIDECLTGNGANDCVFARSYYQFPPDGDGTWQYPDGASLGIPESWPGLGVAPDRVFYTEYPDLTTEFTNEDPAAGLQFCDISIGKTEAIVLLRAIKPFVDNPELIDLLIDYVRDQPSTFAFGLPQNEFQWASEAVLNAPLDSRAEATILDNVDLTSNWRAKTGPGLTDFTLIGGDEPVDFVNLGNDAPALNQMTELSQGRYGWTPVIGTHDLASGHGLCTDQPDGSNDAIAAYAYLIGPADGTNASGSAHPNLLGQHQAYRPPLTETLQSSLLD
jgi:PKD repeat protein